jgi:hypothetical protein
MHPPGEEKFQFVPNIVLARNRAKTRPPSTHPRAIQ